MQEMRLVARSSERAFWRRQLGETLEVVWEERKGKAPDGRWSGLTDNYVRVFAEDAGQLAGGMTAARLSRLTEGGVIGIVEP